jgi:hypothetical protein
METMVIHFLTGGFVVSAFAMIGGLLKPTSFAGLFGAAPSVALATLGLAVAKEGRIYAGTECRSMIVGALAFFIYCLLVCRLLMRYRLSALTSSLWGALVWFVAAFGLLQVFLR